MTDKIVDIRSRMNLISQKWDKLPEHIKRGLTLAKKMDEEDLRTLINMIGTLILHDVEEGLKGHDTQFLFDKIDELYEQYEQEKEEHLATCHFCGQTADTGVCLECLGQKIGGLERYKEWKNDKGEDK